MAPSFSKSFKVLFFSWLLISEANCQVSPSQLHQTTLEFFLQDYGSGPNATVAPVIGIRGKDWSYNTFGTIFVVDDPVMLSSSPSSTPVGRAQGELTVSSLDGATVHVVLSIVFTNLQYNGSTLEIQGISRQSENYRELSVVSGTGRFRFARGFAVLETASYDPATNHSVIRLTITLVQP